MDLYEITKKFPKEERYGLTSEQISRLLDAAMKDIDPYIYLFCLIGVETGMRKMEILSIRLEHINLDRRIIFVAEAKAGQREQPITDH